MKSQTEPLAPVAHPAGSAIPETPVKVDEIRSTVTWKPWLGILVVILIFFAGQILGGLIISIYPLLKGWSSAQANDWLTSSIGGQFAFIAITEALTIYAIYWFLRFNHTSLRAIGFIRPRWRDLGIGLLAAPAYFIIYLITLAIITHFVPDLNVAQHQDVGFSSVHGSVQLILTFISLAVLPPITEELMVRGLLYSSLKKILPTIVAVLLTSLMFAVAHLPEGGSAGPLYIAAIDTFVLSLVLIYLREKTGSLWASITLHACKNSVAFLALYIFVTH